MKISYVGLLASCAFLSQGKSCSPAPLDSASRPYEPLFYAILTFTKH